jgi:CelD/BcsL family acetyltransferase involved in cellulose biosynthesis
MPDVASPAVAEVPKRLPSRDCEGAVHKRRIEQPDLHIRTITSLEEFAELEPVWNDLLEKSDVDHPFLEYLWIRTWLECFGADSKLRMLLVTEAGEPVAIAPLILTTVRLHGMSVRRLGFPYNSHVPRAGFIVARGRDDAYPAIWKYLSESRDWDIVQLCQLPESSATLDLRILAAWDNFRTGVWQSGASFYIPLAEGWDKYYAGLGTKHKSNLRNRFKRLTQSGASGMETITSRDAVAPALEEGFHLEEAAWKREAGTAISCDRDISAFYLKFAERAAERGWLRLNFLRSGSARIAFDYSLHYRNQVFLLKLGYDPAHSQLSPSNLLLSLALQDAFDQGCSGYDFLGEEADWKRCWADQSRPNLWLFIYSKSFKGSVLHLIKFRFIPALKKSLQPFVGFKQRLGRLARTKD